MTTDELVEGAIVHFVLDASNKKRNDHVPAMVTRIHNRETGLVNLTLFLDDGQTLGKKSKAYSVEREPGSWHFLSSD